MIKTEDVLFKIVEKTKNDKFIPIIKKYANGKIEVFGKEYKNMNFSLIKKLARS